MNWQEYFLNYHKDGFERFFKECKKKYYMDNKNDKATVEFYKRLI